MIQLMALFKWTTFDVRSLMPTGWDDKLIQAARRLNQRKAVPASHVTAREASDVSELVMRNVSSSALEAELPWIRELYETVFLQLAQLTSGERVSVGTDDGHTAILNVQTPEDMRYICHVDTNPIQGLLYVTTQPPGTGGELAVGNKTTAASREEIDADCSVIYPQSGHLIFFDGRYNPHYIRPLLGPRDIRVAVAMNYYVPSAPESLRPTDLDDYLFGTVS
jgi:hypothetical protein